MSWRERSKKDLGLPVPADRTKNLGHLPEQGKPSRFPRTSRRRERMDAVLKRRQPTLSVILEDVHDPHNVSAVLRSCDAVGVLDVHLIYVHDEPPRTALNRSTSGSAAKWVRTHSYKSIEACFETLRSGGVSIFAAARREDTVDLYSLDLVAPMALVFGNEQRGVSEMAIALADGTVGIPMQGMVESLNVSVACAVSLYEAMRQRREAGKYDILQLDSNERKALAAEWIKK
jgi:tRNA (guanosine-2'-O-)-methyltransferase